MYIFETIDLTSSNFTLIRKIKKLISKIHNSNPAMHIVSEKIYSNNRRTGVYVASMSSKILKGAGGGGGCHFRQY